MATSIHTGLSFVTLKSQEAGVEMQLLESTQKLIPREVLQSLIIYCNHISESGKIPLLDLQEAKERWLNGDISAAWDLVDPIKRHYPECWTLPQYILLVGGLGIESRDRLEITLSLKAVEELTADQTEVSELLQLVRISLVLGIASDFKSPDFDYRFRELKAKLQYANLMMPLTPSPLMPEFKSSTGK